MRYLFWIVLMLAATVFAGWAVLGTWAPRNGLEMFLTMAFFMGGPIGGFWMLYKAIRSEKRPWPFVFLSFIPMSFVWYYFERVRPSKLNLAV